MTLVYWLIIRNIEKNRKILKILYLFFKYFLNIYSFEKYSILILQIC